MPIPSIQPVLVHGRRAFLAPMMAAPILACALPAAAHAELPPPQDYVNMTLAAEDWVKTDTARVVLVVDAGGGNAGSARDDVMKAARAVSDKGEWHVAAFDRQQDQAGLDHWQATLETRLPENALGALADRARQASRPGLQIHVGQVDFTPTLAEKEAVLARLRQRLYQQAASEAKGLDAAFPGSHYRASSLNFNAPELAMHPRPPIAAPMMKSMMAAPVPGGDGDGLDVAQQVRLTVRVTFNAYAPPAPATTP